jgi:hypothetical protein
VGDAGEVGGGGAKVHGDDDFVDEFGGFGADTRCAEDAARIALDDEFHEAVGLGADERFAVVGEEIFRGEDRDVLRGALALAEAGGGDLRMGEDGEGFPSDSNTGELCSPAISVL